MIVGSNIIVVIVVVYSTGACEFVGVSPQAVANTLPRIFSARRNTLAANAGRIVRRGELRSTLAKNAVLDCSHCGARMGGADLGTPAAAS